MKHDTRSFPVRPALGHALGLAVALAMAAATLGGCDLLPTVSGSGMMTRSAYPVAECTTIQASHAFRVRVVPDPVFSVTVSCDDNLPPYLVVRREAGGSLRLGLAQGYSYIGVTLSAEVHMPVVRAIDASGASSVALDPGFSSAAPLTVVLSGASRLDAPSVTLGAATFDLSGASRVSCGGTAAALSVTASGASQAALIDCAAGSARVDLSGASQAWVDVGPGPITLSASGASTLYYGGSPSFAACNLSGASRTLKVR